MGPTDCIRLFVLCFWLLACDVNCENPRRGYVLRVQARNSPVGVHNDNRDYRRWREPPDLRSPRAGYKTSTMDKTQSGNIYPAQEDHTDSESSQSQSSYPYVLPETQSSNAPKPRVDHFNFGFSSRLVTSGRRTVVYNPSGNKAAAFLGERIQQPNSPRLYRARSQSNRGFSPVHADKAQVGFGPNHRKGLFYSHSSTAGQTRPEVSGYHPSYIFSNSFHHNKTSSLPVVLKPTDRKTDSIMKGHSPGSYPAGTVKTQMPYVSWRPRVYSSDVLPQPRGYAHVWHLKPAFDKTRPKDSSAADRKFLGTGFPSVNQNQGSYSHDSTQLGFSFGMLTSNEKEPNLNNVRGIWHLPPPDKAQIPNQGKFKPFQRLPTNNGLSDSHSSDSQTFSVTTPPPSLNATGVNSTVVPAVEMSTNSSAMQTEGKDAKPPLQSSNL